MRCKYINMATNIDATISVKIDIHSKCIICQEFIDLNEAFAVPPCGHFLHLDCMCLHITTLGEYKTCPSCRGDLTVDETQEHLRRMIYGEYEIVGQHLPQMAPPQPQIITQQQQGPSQPQVQLDLQPLLPPRWMSNMHNRPMHRIPTMYWK